MPRGNCTKREERDKERRKEAIACTHEERKVALWEVALARYNQQSNPNLPKEKAERRLLKQALGNDAATWHSQDPPAIVMAPSRVSGTSRDKLRDNKLNINEMLVTDVDNDDEV